MLKVYLAAPLFNQAEIEFNRKVADRLEKECNCKVLLPQEDAFVNCFDTKHRTDYMLKQMYAHDIANMDLCDVMVVIADGEDVDSGTAVEVGYYVGRVKPIYVLRTDIRKSNDAEYCNFMIQCAATKFFTSLDEMIEYFKENRK